MRIIVVKALREMYTFAQGFVYGAILEVSVGYLYLV